MMKFLSRFNWLYMYIQNRIKCAIAETFTQLYIICSNSSLQYRTFTHVVENVKQDWFAVASLLEHVLQTIKVQLPHVTDVYLRSDNARCYHCEHLWIAIPSISDRTGIWLSWSLTHIF